MSKRKHFWFEAVTKPTDATWLYQVGVDENTPVALVAGPDDYTACARARIICKALNDESRAAVLAANHDDEG
jgi:hypothetical protein